MDGWTLTMWLRGRTVNPLPVAKAAGTVVLVAVAARLGWELLRPMIEPLILATLVWLIYVGWRRRGRRW